MWHESPVGSPAARSRGRATILSVGLSSVPLGEESEEASPTSARSDVWKGTHAAADFLVCLVLVYLTPCDARVERLHLTGWSSVSGMPRVRTHPKLQLLHGHHIATCKRLPANLRTPGGSNKTQYSASPRLLWRSWASMQCVSRCLVLARALRCHSGFKPKDQTNGAQN